MKINILKILSELHEYLVACLSSVILDFSSLHSGISSRYGVIIYQDFFPQDDLPT